MFYKRGQKIAPNRVSSNDWGQKIAPNHVSSNDWGDLMAPNHCILKRLGSKNSPSCATCHANHFLKKPPNSKMSLRYYLPKNPRCSFERELSWLYYKYVAPVEVYWLIRKYFLELLTHTEENLEYYKYHTYPSLLVDYGIPIRYCKDAERRFNSYCRFCGDDLNLMLDIHRYGIMISPTGRHKYYDQPTISGGGIRVQTYGMAPDAVLRFPIMVRLCSKCYMYGRHEAFMDIQYVEDAKLIKYMNAIQLTASMLLHESTIFTDTVRYYLTYNTF